VFGPIPAQVVVDQEPMPAPTVPAKRSEYADRMRLRNAGQRALRLFPRPIALLVQRELEAVAEFGYIVTHTSLAAQCADWILEAPLPLPAPAESGAGGDPRKGKETGAAPRAETAEVGLA